MPIAFIARRELELPHVSVIKLIFKRIWRSASLLHAPTTLKLAAKTPKSSKSRASLPIFPHHAIIRPGQTEFLWKVSPQNSDFVKGVCPTKRVLWKVSAQNADLLLDRAASIGHV